MNKPSVNCGNWLWNVTGTPVARKRTSLAVALTRIRHILWVTPSRRTHVNEDLQARIAEQDVWTFKECLGLGAHFNVKPRFVIAMVLAQGKDYVDGDKQSSDDKQQ